MTQVTANGSTYSDDGSASKDMRDGGHRTWLLPMVSDVMAGINALNANPLTQNLLINPAMEIDQQHEGASVSLTTGVIAYVVDGFAGNFVNASAAVSAQRVADAPAGLRNSLKLTVGTGGTVASNSALVIRSVIEASLLTDIAFGISSAKTLTLSWWVKSSIASYTYAVALQNAAQNRTFVVNKTILSAGVWQQDSVSFQADTGGSWVTSGVAAGAILFFAAAAGSGFAGGASGAWSAGNFLSVAGLTNTVLSTNGATFQITGAKLEIGPAASALERRPLSLEMMLCQRYFEKSYSQGVALGTVTDLGEEIAALWGTTNGQYEWPVRFKVTARAAPTMTIYSPQTGTFGKLSLNATSDITAAAGSIGDSGCNVNATLTPTSLGFVKWHWAKDARL